MTIGGVGANELTVNSALFLRWNLHVVAPHVGETAVGIVRTGEGMALKRYLAQRVNGCTGRGVAIKNAWHRSKLTIPAGKKADGLP